jgi:translation initiation factor 2 beta subunit (eIF-2beta)/eIF-5
MHLNVGLMPNRHPSAKSRKSEIVMAELSERAASGSYPPAETTETEATKLNQSALEFMLGAQKMMFEEFLFFSDEMLERTRTEMRLFTEFLTKMAGAHSVNDVKTMCQECGQHQLDFFRRDSERLFKHSERMIATTSKLISGGPLN